MKAYGSPASEEVVLERRAFCIRSAVWIRTDRLQNLLTLRKLLPLDSDIEPWFQWQASMFLLDKKPADKVFIQDIF